MVRFPKLNGWLCFAVFWSSVAAWSSQAATTTNLPVLTTARQVRQLTPDEALRHYPTRLRGVLTFLDEKQFYRFLQDDTAGIYIFPSEALNDPKLATGQLVEIEGETNPGQYAPTVTPHHVTILGPGTFPNPETVSYEDLISGKEDSQFVAISGVVRTVNFDDQSKYYSIDIVAGGSRVTALATQLPVAQPDDLVDSAVRIRGVCLSRFNLKRQLFDLRLLVPHAEDVEIQEPAPAHPFDAPAHSIEQLLQFFPDRPFGHRVKVQGTVIYQGKAGALYIQGQSEGLLVDTRQEESLYPGDQVEVLGFPSKGEYNPMLQDAIFRKTGSGPEPPATTITVDDALSGTHNCRLVRLEAKVLDRARYGGEPYLLLQTGNCLFEAFLERDNANVDFGQLENGSTVAVTGVCLIEPGHDWHPGADWRAKSFRLLLRSGADVRVLSAPPWWTLRRMLWAVAGLVATILLSFTWVVVLRRRVQKQTQIIRQRLDAEAFMKRRYADLFENANDVVFTTRPSGQITSINAAGEALLQQKRSEILDHNLLSFIAADQRAAAEQWLGDVARGSTVSTAEFDFISLSGQRLRLEISAHMVGHHEIEGIGRDITERNRLEKEILEISTREQQRIGHDLHDGVCQQLAAIAYRLDILSDELEGEGVRQSAEAGHIRHLINDTVNQTRGIARGLFPVRLETEGLVSALEGLSANAENLFKIRCELTCEESPPEMEHGTAIHLYYIAQEAIVNAAKHGEGARVSITLTRLQDRFALTVRDNGPGFRVDDLARGGMGIRIMRYRARVIGATLELKSKPGAGTQMTCLFCPAPRQVANREHDVVNSLF